MQEKMMSEMQSDTADVAMDTESNDDTTQSSDVVADDNSASAAEQQQQLITGQVPDIVRSSVDEVRTENTARDGDGVDDGASSSRELNDGMTVHLPSAHINTNSENPINISSTDAAVASTAEDGDNVSTNIPTPTAASAPSSASASVSSAVPVQSQVYRLIKDKNIKMYGCIC